MDKALEDYRSKLTAACAELKTAGPIHRRDLLRQIRRMKTEITIYKRFHELEVLKHGGQANKPRESISSAIP